VSVTTLYRFYNTDDELLYVGISEKGPERWKAHRKDKPWWTDVARTTTEHYDTRQLALDAERAAIIAEHPKHNVVHNQGSRRPSSTMTSEWDDPRHPINKFPTTDNMWMHPELRSLYLTAMLAIDNFIHGWYEMAGDDGSEIMPTITAGIELLSISDCCNYCRDRHITDWGDPQPAVSYDDGGIARYVCTRCGSYWRCWWNRDADIVRSIG
jgi:predicted GIY-YIG superfamily endonuclease